MRGALMTCRERAARAYARAVERRKRHSVAFSMPLRPVERAGYELAEAGGDVDRALARITDYLMNSTAANVREFYRTVREYLARVKVQDEVARDGVCRTLATAFCGEVKGFGVKA